MTPCPNPQKHAYATRKIALMKAARSKAIVALRVYKCVCRSWHLTSHPKQ